MGRRFSFASRDRAVRQRVQSHTNHLRGRSDPNRPRLGTGSTSGFHVAQGCQGLRPHARDMSPDARQTISSRSRYPLRNSSVGSPDVIGADVRPVHAKQGGWNVGDGRLRGKLSAPAYPARLQIVRYPIHRRSWPCTERY